MNAQVVGTVPQQSSREPGVAILLGVLPFLLVGGALVSFELPIGAISPAARNLITGLLMFGGYLVILLGVLVGWLTGFPRWVMPYLFYAALFAFYLMNVATPGFRLFGIDMWGRQSWGYRACVPFLVVILLGLALTRSLARPWAQLASTLREDWTALAFGIYGMLPAMAVVMDEVNHEYSFPVVLAAESVLALGALLFMLLEGKNQRFGALVICAGLAGLIVGMGSEYFWQLYTVDVNTWRIYPSGEVPDMGRTLWNGIQTAGVVLMLFVLPVALFRVSGFVRRDRTHG